MPKSTSPSSKKQVQAGLQRRRRSKPPPEYAPPDPPALDQAATLRWWRRQCADDWWQSQMPIVPAKLSAVFGMDHGWVGKAINGAPGAAPVLARLGRAIPDIERRRLVFPRHVPGVRKQGEIQPPPFLWVKPPESPPLIPKLAAASAWSLWARCATCGDNKFIPLTLNGQPHAACYRCLPPSQYPALGGKREQRSLIHQALRAFY